MLPKESVVPALVVLATLGVLAPFHLFSSGGSVSVALGPSDPPPAFDYQISLSPRSASLVAGQGMVVLLNLSLVSGTPQNVTLSTRISPTFAPTDSTAQLQPLNVTSGFPPFRARLPITTNPYSVVCYLDPCTGSKHYNITVMAVTSNNVDHNATFTLTVTPTPTPAQPNYLLYAVIGVVAAIAALTTFIGFRRRMRKPSASGSSPSMSSLSSLRSEGWGQ